MAIAPTKQRYRCTLCGAETEWDEDLGPNPLCVECWDARAGKDNDLAVKVAARKRRYYEDHKDEVAARKRRYYEDHKYCLN